MWVAIERFLFYSAIFQESSVARWSPYLPHDNGPDQCCQLFSIPIIQYYHQPCNAIYSDYKNLRRQSPTLNSVQYIISWYIQFQRTNRSISGSEVSRRWLHRCLRCRSITRNKTTSLGAIVRWLKLLVKMALPGGKKELPGSGWMPILRGKKPRRLWPMIWTMLAG